MRQCGKMQRDTYIYGTLDNLSEDERSFEGSGMLSAIKAMTYSGTLWYKDINTKFNWLRDVSSLR